MGGDEIDQPPPTAVFKAGQVLDGRYLIERLVARGGMGEVYVARHLLLGKRVAVKTLRSNVTGDAHRERFQREAHVLASLENDHIVSAFDFGTCPNDVLFLVMEYLDGVSLRALLREQRTLVSPRAVQLLVGVCHGLTAAHAAGAVHRDLKPENIFVCRDAEGLEYSKILDFGLVRLREPDARWRTRTGSALGTLAYMSPEQARGDRDVDGRSDLYAVAAILYEALSGRRTHEADSPLALIHKIINERPPPLREVCDVPVGLSDIVQRGLALEPSKRYQTASELTRALRPYLPAATRQPQLLTLPVPDRPRRSPVRWLVVAGVLGVPVVATSLLTHRTSTGSASVKSPALVPISPANAAISAFAAASSTASAVPLIGTTSLPLDTPSALVPEVPPSAKRPSRPSVAGKSPAPRDGSPTLGFDRDNPYANEQ